MKILCITPIDHIPGINDLLSSIGKLTILSDPSKEDIISADKDFEIIFTNPNKSKIFIGEELFSDWNNLVCVCTASTGTVHIDKDFLKKKQVKLISLTKEYDVLSGISSTAELAFTIMMASLRKIIPANKSVHEEIWDYELFVGRQMDKLNICVFGYGRLGKMFSNYSKVFGSKVFVYDPYKKIPNDFIGLTSIDDNLKDIDVISIHMHVNEETKNFFNKTFFKKLKPSVLIVNTSRGELVNEDDLIEFLESNPRAKIASDVLSGEIFGFNKSKLYQYSKKSSQVLLTPHIGGMTIDAQEIAYSHASNLLINYIKRKNLSK
jgi:D-3-phosphoglycerate dehydrogenase